jgi:hypothetical protein
MRLKSHDCSLKGWFANSFCTIKEMLQWGYSAFQYIMGPQALKESAARTLLSCADASQGPNFGCLGPPGLGSEVQNPA